MKKNILIIEDDTSLAEGLQILLIDEGYMVFVESNGSDALKKLTEYNPDLFLIDYRLPGRDGGVISKKIKSTRKFKNVPVILMSASQYAMPSIAKNSGASAFFSKPFEMNELIYTIESLLQEK